MPKLKGSAKALARLRSKNWEVERMLPDIEAIAAKTSAIADPVNYFGAQYAFESAMIWQESSQMGLGAIVSNIGIPSANVFRTAVDIVKVDIVAQVQGVLVAEYGSMRDIISAIAIAGDDDDGGEIMKAAIEFGVGMVIKVVTAVNPIAGFVVKLVWGVGKFIRNIVKLVKDDDYGEAKVLYPASTFAPWLDNSVLNGIIGDMRTTRDWTRLFCPPRMGQGIAGNDFYVRTIGSGQREIFRDFGRTDAGQSIDWLSSGWTGFVPGTAVLHQGTRLRSTISVSEIGSQLLPSPQNLLFWVWKEVTGKGRDVSPTLYTIDSKMLGDSWAGYISDYHVWLSETDKIGTASKEAILKYYNGKKGAKIFGWGTKIDFGGDAEMDRYQPVKEAKILRKRQMAYLDTLMCAYVDESYIAISSDSQLRARWDQRRRQLLEHPARCDVDLDVVPDKDYREELERRRSPSACAPAAKLAWLPPPNPPDGQGGAAGLGEGDDQPGTTRSGGMGKIVLAGAALGGLFLAHRKGWI